VVEKLCGKWIKMSLLLFMVCFLTDFFIFFNECDLFRLRNMFTKFRKPAFSDCKVMWKMCKNVITAFIVCFLSDFFNFFLIYVIYLG
jgi:hypothetical protein